MSGITVATVVLQWLLFEANSNWCSLDVAIKGVV